MTICRQWSTIATILTPLSLAVSAVAAAQDQDTPGVLFSWGSINVALAPDNTAGLRLLSATTPKAGPAVGQRSFEVALIPDSAERWAASAESLVAHPPDTGWSETRALLSRWGSGIMLALHRERAGGDVERILVFVQAGKAVLRVTLTGNTATDFITAVQEQALQARWAPRPPKVISTGVPTTLDTGAVVRSPRYLRGPMLVYPEELRLQSVTGAVWAHFIVDSTGRVEDSTFQVIYSSSRQFSAAVRRWAEGARYEPAAINGHPIPVLVEVPFTFTLY